MYLDAHHPFRQRGSIRNEIDNLLHDFFGGPIHTGPMAGAWMPPAEITETESQVIIKAELPGIDETDMELEISDGTLMIRGEKKCDLKEKGQNHFLCERYYGSFHRTLQLPPGIDADRAEAKYKKGVLQISIPKLSDARRKIIQLS